MVLICSDQSTKSRDLHRWDIRVQSTTSEHVANGMTTRLNFNVLPIKESDGEGLPSGIDFSVYVYVLYMCCCEFVCTVVNW